MLLIAQNLIIINNSFGFLVNVDKSKPFSNNKLILSSDNINLFFIFTKNNINSFALSG